MGAREAKKAPGQSQREKELIDCTEKTEPQGCCALWAGSEALLAPALSSLLSVLRLLGLVPEAPLPPFPHNLVPEKTSGKVSRCFFL